MSSDSRGGALSGPDLVTTLRAREALREVSPREGGGRPVRRRHEEAEDLRIVQLCRRDRRCRVANLPAFPLEGVPLGS